MEVKFKKKKETGDLNMEKTIWIVLGAIAVLAIFGLMAYGTYSSLVSKQVDAEKAIGDLHTEFQRRADLLPNMMKSAEASMKFQKELIVGYAEAREGLRQANDKYQEALKNPKNPDSAALAMKALGDAKASWLVINARTESVPQANLDQITQLNNEMAALENVIAKKRQDYNTVVSGYNKMVRIPPSSWFASFWDFKEMKFFEAQQGAEKMPEMKLNI